MRYNYRNAESHPDLGTTDKNSVAPWTHWPARWEHAVDACVKRGGKAESLTIAGPANEAEVEQVEKSLGFSLPQSFRSVLLEFSAHVNVSWVLPDAFRLPKSYDDVQWGSCSWDLSAILDAETDRASWIKECFPNLNDPYDAVWHNKLSFRTLDNGDHLALDLASPSAPVVYLSHDDGAGHGYRLGEDFIDFIERCSLLGCPGPEEWVLMPFVSSPTGGLEPFSTNAVLWREWFGLQLDE